MTEEGQETPATDSGHSQVADDANDRSSRDVPMKGHSEISSDIQALLGDMQTSFKNFSESIFSTIDNLSSKLDSMEKNLHELSEKKTTDDDRSSDVPTMADAACGEGDMKNEL